MAQDDVMDQKAKPTPQQRAERLTKMMTRQLNLNAEQVEPVKAINLKYAELNEKSKGNRKEMKANVEAKNKELKAVLTPEQYDNYLKLEERIKEKIRERREDKKVPINE